MIGGMPKASFMQYWKNIRGRRKKNILHCCHRIRFVDRHNYDDIFNS
jgi:hypothetical protein